MSHVNQLTAELANARQIHEKLSDLLDDLVVNAVLSTQVDQLLNEVVELAEAEHERCQLKLTARMGLPLRTFDPAVGVE